jgi:hypothetical protein
MTGPRNAQTDFDVAALFGALDAQRRDRRLSWQERCPRRMVSVRNAQRST